jgi:hypothetical protein
MGELRAMLHETHFERVQVLLSSWAGQQINVPASVRWRVEAAQMAAQRMHAQGLPSAVHRLEGSSP